MLCRVARGGGAREAQVARTNAARSMAAEGLLLYQSPLALRRLASGDRCRRAAMRTLFERRVWPRYTAALNRYSRSSGAGLDGELSYDACARTKP